MAGGKTIRLRSVMGLGVVGLGLGLLGLGQPARAHVEGEWHNCFTREVFTPAKQTWCRRWQTLQSGTYTVPTSLLAYPTYTTVTLADGQYQMAGELMVVLANDPGWIAFGDLDGDGREDAAVMMGVMPGGGTAMATYVTAVMDIDGSAQALNPVALGDRVILSDPITIENLRLQIPQRTPTEVINRTLMTSGGLLREFTPTTPTSPLVDADADGTLIFSNTTTYAVRVFLENNQPYINLYNHQTGHLDLDRVPALILSAPEGDRYQSLSTTPNQPSVQLGVGPNGSQSLEVNTVVQRDGATVTGTLTYRSRLALPVNAVVEVELVDISRADAPAVILASQRLTPHGRQVPLPFELVYDPQRIDPNRAYAVQARITVDGDRQFTGIHRLPVMHPDTPTPVEMVLDPVRR